jgi:hypothetical protein
MKHYLKRLIAIGLGLGISLTGISTAFAADLTWTEDTTITVGSASYIILGGSTATTMIVGSSSVTVTVPAGGDFRFRSNDSYVLNNDQGLDQTCTDTYNQIHVIGSVTAAAVVITPDTTRTCSLTGRGSGGGGGGGNNTPSTPPMPVPTEPILIGSHSIGSLVKSADGTVWFITPAGQRRPFTSAGALLSYGFLSFSQIVDANTSDLALPQGPFIPPQDGKVICSDRDDSYAKKGTCYLITASKRAAFTSAAVFTGQGFKFARSTSGEVSFMATDADIRSATSAHRPGVLVNNNGTIQLVGAGGLMGVTSESVFMSWGYDYADTVPANAADKVMAQSGVMQSRVTGQLSPQ